MARIRRRTFLRAGALGAAAATLPFLRVLDGRAQMRKPKRFLAIFTPNGTIADEWIPDGGETDFRLKRILEPLEPFREKLLILDGLDMRIPGTGGGHQAGIGALLTGAGLRPGDFCGGNNCSSRSGWPDGHSIDQEIANSLAGTTPFASLELGVRVRSGAQRRHIAYRGVDDPLPHVDDPYEVFDRIFGDVMPNADAEALERLRREERSVLDAVRGDLNALSQRLDSEHRNRMDAHLESLRDVERRLDSRLSPEMAVCEPPMLGSRIDPGAEANFPEIGRMQMDLITAAFACDRTRVATLLWSGATSNQRFPWLGLEEVRDDNGNPTTAHHSYSHVSDRAKEPLIQINRWYAEQLAYLLGKLDAIPEPNGEGTLLDNSVIFWGNELSNGDSHSRDNMKFVVAGSGGGYFRTGRFLQYGNERHNDLLVSMANAMDVEIDRFGNRDFSNGPLGNLR
ncbi:MAG: DUF1552 domain-containing protein [Myxococcota bacterium]